MVEIQKSRSNIKMKCWIKACKYNKEGKCTKYKNEEELVKDFKQGGGCALTWFFTGRIPKQVSEK